MKKLFLICSAFLLAGACAHKQTAPYSPEAARIKQVKDIISFALQDTANPELPWSEIKPKAETAINNNIMAYADFFKADTALTFLEFTEKYPQTIKNNFKQDGVYAARLKMNIPVFYENNTGAQLALWKEMQSEFKKTLDRSDSEEYFKAAVEHLEINYQHKARALASRYLNAAAETANTYTLFYRANPQETTVPLVNAVNKLLPEYFKKAEPFMTELYAATVESDSAKVLSAKKEIQKVIEEYKAELTKY